MPERIDRLLPTVEQATFVYVKDLQTTVSIRMNGDARCFVDEELIQPICIWNRLPKAMNSAVEPNVEKLDAACEVRGGDEVLGKDA